MIPSLRPLSARLSRSLLLLVFAGRSGIVSTCRDLGPSRGVVGAENGVRDASVKVGLDQPVDLTGIVV